MKNIFLTLAAVFSFSGCASYAGRVDYPYYHYSCANYNNEVVCGNHYYPGNGLVHYYDAEKNKWVGYRRFERKY